LRLAVVHGPNLRLLGRREPRIYGHSTLDDVNDALQALAGELGVELDTFQSNHEGEILDFIEDRSEACRGYLVNPGALAHTSVALRDALVGVGRPFVEVHISNTASREPFRHHSHLSPVASGVVYGFGADGYLLGLRGLVSRLSDS